MVSKYPKINYDYEAIKLKKIYEHPLLKDFPCCGVQSDESIKVFGELRFPELPNERCYTTACFVTSMDGKLAYPDNPAGPVIAQSNGLDPVGATADFWALNLMRASCDAIFMGAVTMQKEPNSLTCIFDQTLEDERVRLGMQKAPWIVVSSFDGTDIPFGDTLLENQPVMFNTSPVGAECISKNIKQDFYIVGSFKNKDEIDARHITKQFDENKYKKTPVIITGEGTKTDTGLLLHILKIMGINIAMVESPSYCHSMLQSGLLDEIMLNYSCVYIGGKALGFGGNMESFTSTNHPHTEVLSIHSHSPSFFYFRHKIVYGITPNGYLGAIY